MAYLEVAANIAAILTAIIASWAYVYYRWSRHCKMRKLEDYLKAEKLENPGKRTHTVLHLMANVGLTEDEVLRASFESKHIRRALHVNYDTHLADEILFEYQD